MKNRIIILLVSFLVLYPSCIGKGKEPKKTMSSSKLWCCPDDTITNHLGNTLTEILFNPQKVICYAVEREDSISSDQLEPNFSRGEQICKLSKEEIAIIQFSLLSNQENYVNDTLLVMCPYIPKLDFEFTGRKGKKANLLISPSDFSWSILFDGKKQFRFNTHSIDMKRLCNFYIQEGRKRVQNKMKSEKKEKQNKK